MALRATFMFARALAVVLPLFLGGGLLKMDSRVGWVNQCVLDRVEGASLLDFVNIGKNRVSD